MDLELTILITGGTGFVGSRVASEILKREKEKVILFDVKPKKRMLLKQHKKSTEIVTGDIRNIHDILDSCKNFGVDRIVHMAAVVDVDVAEKNPYQAYAVNVGGMCNVCEVSRRMDIEKTVFTSSGAVYGKQKGPLSEDSPYNSADIYSATKIMAETIGLQYVRSYGIDLLIDRLYFVYGPDMFFEPINPLSMIQDAVKGKPSVFKEGGDQLWDLTYVTDASDGIILTLFAKRTEHKVFNISSGRAHTLFQIAQLVKKHIPEANIKIGPGDAAVSRGAPLNIARAKKELGYEPKIRLEDGVKRLISKYVG